MKPSNSGYAQLPEAMPAAPAPGKWMPCRRARPRSWPPCLTGQFSIGGSSRGHRPPDEIEKWGKVIRDGNIKPE